jgi:hypothetical protein
LRRERPAQGLIQQWVQRALYYELPGWVFTLAYTAFAAAVLATWWVVPPRRRGRSS